jgi:ribosomal protein S18 acetylase RimI-like enzyme
VALLRVTIREALRSEYERLAELYVQAWSELAPHVGPERWERMRSNISNLAARATFSEILVAEKGGTMLGAVTYSGPGRRPDAAPGPLRLIPLDWAYVGILAVAPEHRGRGVGRSLTESCVERARRDEAPSLGLGTRPVMAAAQRLYERMGFGRRHDLEAGQDEYLVYELPLRDRL